VLAENQNRRTKLVFGIETWSNKIIYLGNSFNNVKRKSNLSPVLYHVLGGAEIMDNTPIRISLADMGFQLVIAVKKTIRIRLPIPLKKGTILYSLRRQGWIKSFKNRFTVPLVHREL
jgi:hypothetical protein